MAGKPAVVTRVVDSMTDNLRPTRAEATDVANAVLDGKFLIILVDFQKTLVDSGLYSLDILVHGALRKDSPIMMHNCFYFRE